MTDCLPSGEKSGTPVVHGLVKDQDKRQPVWSVRDKSPRRENLTCGDRRQQAVRAHT